MAAHDKFVPANWDDEELALQMFYCRNKNSWNYMVMLDACHCKGYKTFEELAIKVGLIRGEK